MNAPRKKPGPKTGLAAGTAVARKNLTLDESTERKLLVLGGGNLSLAVRLAADFTYQGYQNGRFNPPAPDQVK